MKNRSESDWDADGWLLEMSEFFTKKNLFRTHFTYVVGHVEQTLGPFAKEFPIPASIHRFKDVSYQPPFMFYVLCISLHLQRISLPAM